MNNYIRLALGQPLEVVLQDPVGVATTSPADRPQVEFRLVGGQTLCATGFQAGKIKKLNPRAGDRLRLLMSKNTEGKSITEVELLPPAAAAVPARPAPQPTPITGGPSMEDQLRSSIAAANARNGAVPPPRDADDPGYGVATNVHSDGRNGNGNGHSNGAPTPKPAPQSLMNGQGQARLAFFQAAVDLAIATRHYAALGGLQIDISFEDIRCIANSWCIEAQKNGGR